VKNGVLPPDFIASLNAIVDLQTTMIDAMPDRKALDLESQRVFDHMLNARSFTRLALAGQKEGK